MTRRTISLAVAPFLIVGLAGLAGCDQGSQPSPAAPVVWDDDVCVPPTPSPTGAPWVEADDRDLCVPDGRGGWTQAPDGPENGGHAKASRTSKNTRPDAKPKAKTTTRKQTEPRRNP